MVGDQVTTVRADVGALPYPDGHVDRVLTLTGLHCFPDPHRAVVEMARVLRPGGALGLVWNARDVEVGWVAALESLVAGTPDGADGADGACRR